MEKYGFVYLWYDRKHKRFYIGCHWGTINDGYICSSTNMKAAYKRRPQDFKRRVLVRVYTKEKLLEEEYYYLKMIKPEELKTKYYNLHNHHFGHWSYCEKTKLTAGQKISKAHRDNPNWGSWSKGKIVSEETKQKLRQHNLGKKHSEEAKSKCRAYRHTDEARRKISEAVKLRHSRTV